MMSLQAIDLGAGSGKPYMVLAGNQRALYDNQLNNLAPRQWESGQGQRIGDKGTCETGQRKRGKGHVKRDKGQGTRGRGKGQGKGTGDK